MIAHPKPAHKRFKPTAKQRGHIGAKARKEAKKRSQGRCERCGWQKGNYDPKGAKWGLQASHLIRRWQLDITTGKDIAYLCGPSTNTGTCHHWIDSTREGKMWAKQYRESLIRHE